MAKKIYKYKRKPLEVSEDVHTALKEYCRKNHPGLKLYSFVDNICKEFLNGKGVFLP